MIAWLDTETTGLEPENDYLLEVGIVITDDELNVAASHSEVCSWRIDAPLFANRLDMNEGYVRGMHNANGLLLDVELCDKSMIEAERDLVTFMNEHFSEPPVMGGASITHDRRFLAAHMPVLLGQFHYRSIDISVIRELAARWAPDIRANEPEAQGNHRVIGDLIDSIRLLNYYRETGFLGGNHDLASA